MTHEKRKANCFAQIEENISGGYCNLFENKPDAISEKGNLKN